MCRASTELSTGFRLSERDLALNYTLTKCEHALTSSPYFLSSRMDVFVGNLYCKPWLRPRNMWMSSKFSLQPNFANFLAKWRFQTSFHPLVYFPRPGYSYRVRGHIQRKTLFGSCRAAQGEFQVAMSRTMYCELLYQFWRNSWFCFKLTGFSNLNKNTRNTLTTSLLC